MYPSGEAIGVRGEVAGSIFTAVSIGTTLRRLFESTARTTPALTVVGVNRGLARLRDQRAP